jgi:hypothetical protein
VSGCIAATAVPDARTRGAVQAKTPVIKPGRWQCLAGNEGGAGRNEKMDGLYMVSSFLRFNNVY